MSHEDLKDLIILSMVPGVGPLTYRALVESLGSPSAVLRASVRRLQDVPNVGPKVASKIAGATKEFDAEAVLSACRDAGVRVVALDDEDYPASVRRIEDPPPVLYLRGTTRPTDQLAVAVVGARHATPYGLRIAERLGYGLAQIGLTVVSGLARGIDAAAHRGALRGGGRTFGVLANGLSTTYPPEHEDLGREVSAQGALITEFPLHQKPLAGLFPQRNKPNSPVVPNQIQSVLAQRNRLISGLALGVVIVEADRGDVVLTTAQHAIEQNREVFAVPGPVDSPASRGCHALIRDGARLVETVEDIMEEIGPMVQAVRPRQVHTVGRAEASLNELERSILSRMDSIPMSADELASETGLTASQARATLRVLEMRKLVRMVGVGFVRHRL